MRKILLFLLIEMFLFSNFADANELLAIQVRTGSGCRGLTVLPPNLSEETSLIIGLVYDTKAKGYVGFDVEFFDGDVGVYDYYTNSDPNAYNFSELLMNGLSDGYDDSVTQLNYMIDGEGNSLGGGGCHESKVMKSIDFSVSSIDLIRMVVSKVSIYTKVSSICYEQITHWEFWDIDDQNEPPVIDHEKLYEVSLNPKVLHKKRQGKYLTCYIEPRYGYSIYKIDPETDIDLAYKVIDSDFGYALPLMWKFGDYDKDGTSDLMVKFDSQKILETADPEDTNWVMWIGECGAPRIPFQVKLK